MRRPPRACRPGRSLHLFIQDLTASDATGRVGQMACTCPGLLVLLEELWARGHHLAEREILGAIIAGERLGRLLHRAATSWLEIVPRRDGGYPGREERQRLYLRLAGHRVGAAALWRGAPPILVAEDVPKDRGGNAAWYRFMYQALPAIRWSEGVLTPAQHRDLCGFVSRRGLDLMQLYRSIGANPGTQLRLLSLYAGGSGRHIGRSTRVEKLVTEMTALHARRTRHRRQRALILLDEGTACRPFPASPLVASLPRTEGGAMLELLPDPAAVFQEAMRMDHCAADYIPAAASGACHLLRATVDGQSLTVLIEKEPSRGEFRLSEIAGKANRAASPDEIAAVRRCLRGVVLDADSCVEDSCLNQKT